MINASGLSTSFNPPLSPVSDPLSARQLDDQSGYGFFQCIDLLLIEIQTDDHKLLQVFQLMKLTDLLN